jgi:predicted kinase
MEIKPSEPQGKVIAAAKEQAKQLLRNQQNFAWNATNISRDIRCQLTDLFASYNAKIEISYIETTEPKILQRNQQRKNPVPDKILENMIKKWTIPTPTEAHTIQITET